MEEFMATEQGKKFAVVTGASSGIGYELARQFAQHGYDLLVASKSGGIIEAAQAFRAEGCDVQTVQADLATHEGIEALYKTIIATGRPVDAIAINAGVGVGGKFIETSLEAEHNIINLNVMSPVHLSKLVVPHMVKRGKGRILFTASVAATMPGPYEAVYAASKSFVLSFAEALRKELEDTGVSVTALMPGPTDTNFFRRAGMLDTKAGAGKKDDPAMVAKEAFEALMADDDHVVTGAKNKVQTFMAHFMPDTMRAALHGSMTEPGSAKH